MKGTIEITVRTVPGGKVLTNVEGKKCSEKDVLEVMTSGFCAMAANCMREVPQRFEGKEAAFMTELLTRQGEVQDE